MNTQERTATVEQQVRTFIADNYQYREKATTLSDTDSFLAHGIIDSMGVLELINFIETTYPLKVADDEVVPENLDTIAKVGAYVRRKLGVAGNGHAG